MLDSLFSAQLGPFSDREYEADSCFSVNSIDDMLACTDDTEQNSAAWHAELADRIEEILDRKRSSVQGRETTLAAYVRTLTAQYAEEEIRGKDTELVIAFLKSIKAETSEKETILALKGEQNGRMIATPLVNKCTKLLL